MAGRYRRGERRGRKLKKKERRLDRRVFQTLCAAKSFVQEAYDDSSLPIHVAAVHVKFDITPHHLQWLNRSRRGPLKKIEHRHTSCLGEFELDFQ